ncbi:MAG: SDR family oxidoreductase, partial [Planctomycetota bacterium]
MPTTLITGANRGIGLELARFYAARGDDVIATARKPEDAHAARELGVRVEPLDIADASSIDRLASALEGVEIDRLVNNAGVFPDRGAGMNDIDAEATMHCFRVNTLGPVLLTRALRPRLAKGALIVNISSTMGSIARARDNASSRNLAYHASKAALNMMTSLIASDLADDGVRVVAMHPGWVRTDMGGGEADLDTRQSVTTMARAWDKLTPKDAGAFLDTDGAPLPW